MLRERTSISKGVKPKALERTENQSIIKTERERQAKQELEEIKRKRGELSTECNELNEKYTKDKGKGKMVYEEERVKVKERIQVRNDIAKRDNEKEKSNYQVNEEERNSSIYKKNGK